MFKVAHIALYLSYPFEKIVSFSVIWVDDFSPDLAVYSARCEYIKPTFSDLRARLIDVGFLGR